MTRRERPRGARALMRGVVRTGAITAAGAAGCASLGSVQQPMSARGAAREAVVAVCGDRRGADSACTVRGVERAGRGYRVVVDRRTPRGLAPAGADRLRVTVQPSGVLGGWAVDVVPLTAPVLAARDTGAVGLATRTEAAQHADVRNHDPARAKIVTRDVHHFWQAYDAARGAPDSAARVAAYRELYVRAGAPTLDEWTRTRLADPLAVQRALEPRGWPQDRFFRAWQAPPADTAHVALLAAAGPRFAQSAAEQLAAAVAARPRFYAGVRRGTLGLDSLGGAVDQIRARYRRLAALYPDAVFPPVYFVVGRLNSGGTTGPDGIFVGAEMRGADPATPRDELSAWERGAVGDAAGVPRVVAHELVHVEQAAARGRAPDVDAPGRKTLLAQALDEGCADFLADVMSAGADTLVAGGDLGVGYRAYGLAHERALWQEFRPVMLGTSTRGWLYEPDPAKARPQDLGYFVGARICRAYYDRAPDKRRAVRDILVMADPRAFVAASGYAP